VDEVENML